MWATMRPLKTIYISIVLIQWITVHVESFRRKLRGRNTWSTAPTCLSTNRWLLILTWVAINKCSIYLDFGAANLTFVAPKYKMQSAQILDTRHVTAQKKLRPSQSFGIITFDRLFVCRGHFDGRFAFLIFLCGMDISRRRGLQRVDTKDRGGEERE